ERLGAGRAECREEGWAEGREGGWAKDREEGWAEGREKGWAEDWREGWAEGREEDWAEDWKEGGAGDWAEGREEGRADGWAVLSPEERRRARRFMRPAEASHYVHAHAGVRQIMAGLLDCPPRAIRFGREPCPGCGDAAHGRPSVIEPTTTLRFNHSRSEAAWLLAVALDGRRVGADIEQIQPLNAFTGLLDGCLTPAERAYVVDTADPVRRRRRFYRCWVRKEAVLKAVGTGLAGGLTRLDVRPYEPGTALVRADGPGAGSFLVHDIPLGRGLAAAVAEEST
ncbi:4'-phosphopantetheinyl transferase superfamily protein, partial [Streptomyces varsoviensis]|uniref:4'-phosphopantetheinyl transferase superfamily protein n=1 Tax=Streptomyces varsoviensis TaxID=67373 RepID=UPI000661FB79